MLFFDFLFYRICKFYLKFGEKGAESSSAGIIGGLQALNLLTIDMIVESQLNEKVRINVFLVIGLFLIFQIYSYIRYIYNGKNSVEMIEKKWLNKTESQRERFIVFQYIYIGLSVLCCFGLAIYLGSRV